MTSSAASDPKVLWQARDKKAACLVRDCVSGKIPFSGPGSLFEAFTLRGWNTRYLYEAVRNEEGQ